MPPAIEQPPDLSQSSSHTTLEPISGAVLFEQEARRREALVFGKGNCVTGCRELDQSVLVGGGFERGSVVGISAEDDEFGLVLGLQTISRLLVRDHGQTGATRGPRAMIITTMVMGALMATLSGVLKAELAASGGRGDTAALKEVLERISISRVFDLSGLWDVLAELEQLRPSRELGEHVPASDTPLGHLEKPIDVTGGRKADAFGDAEISQANHRGPKDAELNAIDPAPNALFTPASSFPRMPLWKTSQTDEMHPLQQTPPHPREEILDSDAEDEEFSSPLLPREMSQEEATVTSAKTIPRDDPASSGECWYPNPDDAIHLDGAPPLSPVAKSHQEQAFPSAAASTTPQKDDVPKTEQLSAQYEQSHPHIILITNMSTLLSSLFHQREKASAHHDLKLLASHLRYVTRSSDHGGPLIIILNSTTSSDTATGSTTNLDPDAPPMPPLGDPATTTKRALDPTLRSIFNPPLLPFSGLSAVYRFDVLHSRRSKPSFGLIFSQMLDIHLLCTKIPKYITDAETYFARPMHPKPGITEKLEFAWVVETLLDEIGVWKGREIVVGGQPRTLREQRWGAVELTKDKSGLRITDAFDKKKGSS